MKAMVIGINPEYNYPGRLNCWLANNTYYASNFGASLICRTLMKHFDADYIDDFSDIQLLQKKYDVCFLALATHITDWRDVTYYADIIEKLQMKVIAPSLGLQDFAQTTNEVFSLHPSVKRLLELVSDFSAFLGVRGPHTASILSRNGFSNVIPIGCPTMYWGMKDNLVIQKTNSCASPLLVYHQSICSLGPMLLKKYRFLGQDFEDESFFTENLRDDHDLRNAILQRYKNFPDHLESLELLKNKGIFPKSFRHWFETIGKHDFIFGPRLHGCIAALVMGIPAVMTPRDLRIQEMVDFYSIPSTPLTELKNVDAEYLYNSSSFDNFNEIYPVRFRNYLQFLAENGVSLATSAANQ
jgi:hypothetical protein